MGGEIRLVDLVKRFDDFTAVDGINLAIPAGKFFSLLGPSGCGKTTTLRMVGGFERPTSGQVLLDGEDMAGRPPNPRRGQPPFPKDSPVPHTSVFAHARVRVRLAH